ncbi:hypothetical protein BCR34DRAFT_529182 [Clohesyomyces aquaticus]|uniref:TauD/TfdA-like domain-containing protein n=1 Tax=Clohesyomyces aquaticus TaxID=1231657 RepID=A0A1Y2A7N7_9PLEO|nr:hypothetical protein BCR34DRAFT_529182 [Clohesyomyces aquaticus]
MRLPLSQSWNTYENTFGLTKATLLRRVVETASSRRRSTYSPAQLDDSQHSDIGMAPLLAVPVSFEANIDPNTTFPVTIEARITLNVDSRGPSRPAKGGTTFHNDRALAADREKKSLLSDATRTDLNKSIGTVLSGIEFTTLSPQQLDELALLVSERGVVFIREQRFHPTEQVRVFKRLGKSRTNTTTANKDGSFAASQDPEQLGTWQSDACFESDPPSYSLLTVEDTPDFGRNPAWVSQYGLYDELSAHMKGFVSGLHAIHQSKSRVIHHPAVRTHPVTRLKALNMTPSSVAGFAELKKKESDNLLHFLDDHFNSETQHIVHWEWEPRSIVLWDNRCTAFKATPSGFASHRQSTRTTIIGEKPYLDPSSESRQERAERLEREEVDRAEQEAIKKRYNNTPLRRILSQQVLGMQPEYVPRIQDTEPVADSVKKSPSRADSVLSTGSASDGREDRTAQWTKEVNGQVETPKPATVPIRRSNTPLRRILERQVSSPIVGTRV